MLYIELIAEERIAGILTLKTCLWSLPPTYPASPLVDPVDGGRLQTLRSRVVECMLFWQGLQDENLESLCCMLCCPLGESVWDVY